MPDTAVNPVRLDRQRVDPRPQDIYYSVRRYYVDEFYARQVATLPRGATVLDIGGKRAKKRGQFDIGAFDLKVTYVNISKETEPDILGSAEHVPLPDASADAVILAETVEHLPDPAAALREASRLLHPGGVLLATAPFMFRVHPDPLDVGRYAPDWWQARLAECRFRDVVIERQGAMLSVLADLLRGWVEHMTETKSFWPGLEMALPHWVRNIRENLPAWESREGYASDPYYQSYTTGFGIRAVRA